MNRDDIIKMAMDVDGHMNDRRGGIDLSWDSLVRIVQKAIAAEREACAKVCDAHESLGDGYMGDHFRECAAEIRARGTA